MDLEKLHPVDPLPLHEAVQPRDGVTRVWIDVGAHRGEHSRAAAQHDPGITLHAFEPLPTLFAELVHSPPNNYVHTMAIGEQDGMAAFA
jgi:FkbM family methyltransferase